MGSEWGENVTEETLCVHCGRAKGEHGLVNATDGVVVGGFMLLCPTSTFEPVFTHKTKRERKKEAPDLGW